MFYEGNISICTPTNNIQFQAVNSSGRLGHTTAQLAETRLLQQQLGACQLQNQTKQKLASWWVPCFAILGHGHRATSTNRTQTNERTHAKRASLPITKQQQQKSFSRLLSGKKGKKWPIYTEHNTARNNLKCCRLKQPLLLLLFFSLTTRVGFRLETRQRFGALSRKKKKENCPPQKITAIAASIEIRLSFYRNPFSCGCNHSTLSELQVRLGLFFLCFVPLF